MASDFDPRTATLSELLDWHAQRLKRISEPSGSRLWSNYKSDSDGVTVARPCVGQHPVPVTIDAAAALMPEGVDCWRWNGWYYAMKRVKDGHDEIAKVPDTGDEIADRLWLAALAIQEMEER